MKMMWLVNLPLPDAAKALALDVPDTGSWITGQVNGIKRHAEIELTVLAPSILVREEKRIVCDNITYLVFPVQKNYRSLFRRLLDEVRPHVVHIFGTEYTHTWDMMQEADAANTVISIQGMLFVCAQQYLYGLPRRYTHRNPLKVLMSRVYCGDDIKDNQLLFLKNAQAERKTLQIAKHVIGRTDWDKACALQLNPHLQYHFCNEILRDSFYSGVWNIDACQRHSILISQGKYPIKGLHLFLPVLAELVKDYPDIMVNIAGTPPVTSNNAIVRAGVSFFFEYQSYCQKLMRRYGIEKHICFIGVLNEKEMKEQYLKTHVFVSCSTIENESNSISEAKILGTPVVASFVGGVTSRIEQGKDGFVYPLSESNMAAYYIRCLFEDDTLCMRISQAARQKAAVVNNREANLQALLHIYDTVQIQTISDRKGIL
ncbi:MAG: glycosyltransferase [Ruthenibacterium sp.]